MEAKTRYFSFPGNAFALLAMLLLGGCTSVMPGLSESQNQAPITIPVTGSVVAAPKVVQQPVEAGFYRVNAGDTLLSVADAFGWSADAVAQWNNLDIGATLSEGQILRVSPPPVKPAPSSMVTVSQGNQTNSTTSEKFLWPAKGQIVQLFSSDKQSGIVISGTPNEDVDAVAPGIVVYAGDFTQNYGTMVIVRHDNNLVTAYYNASKLLVKEGDQVQAGQAIAQMGQDNQGRSVIGFEVRLNGQVVDPLSYLQLNSN